MPPQTETQTLPVPLPAAPGSGGVARTGAAGPARAGAECVALRRRNEVSAAGVGAAGGRGRRAGGSAAARAAGAEDRGDRRLTGGIAHDFNNLLTVMSGGLYLLPRAAYRATDPPHGRRGRPRHRGDARPARLRPARAAAPRTHRSGCPRRGAGVAADARAGRGGGAAVCGSPPTRRPIVADPAALELVAAAHRRERARS